MILTIFLTLKHYTYQGNFSFSVKDLVKESLRLVPILPDREITPRSKIGSKLQLETQLFIVVYLCIGVFVIDKLMRL